MRRQEKWLFANPGNWQDRHGWLDRPALLWRRSRRRRWLQRISGRYGAFNLTERDTAHIRMFYSFPPGCSPRKLSQLEIAEVHRDQQRVTDRLQAWSAHIDLALGRKSDSLHRCVVVHILRRHKTASHIRMTVMPAQ
jgi:hypothetical protein